MNALGSPRLLGTKRALFWSLAATALALAPSGASAGGPRPTPVADESLALATPKSFTAAVEAIQRATGAQPDRLELGGKPVAATEGRSFALEARTASRLLAGSHDAFRKGGFYLFRYDRSYGLPGEKDKVGLLATTDPDVVMRRVGTAGTKRGVTTEQIIAWLHALEKDEAFEVTEIGADFIYGRFERAPTDPPAIARRTAQFAPDLVKGHSEANAISGLSDLIGRKRILYLLWDN